MGTFRQTFVVAVVCFAGSIATVAWLPQFPVWPALGMIWSVATGPLLPITITGLVVLALLLYWNPRQ